MTYLRNDVNAWLMPVLWGGPIAVFARLILLVINHAVFASACWRPSTTSNTTDCYGRA